MPSPPVALFLAEQFQHVRLVEIPDELLDLITKGEELYFKSSLPLSSSSSLDKGGHLHLCSNERSWLVKQVSTSNSVYVTQTKISNLANGHDQNSKGMPDGSRILADSMIVDSGNQDVLLDEDIVAETSTHQRLTAIAKPTNVLELHPVSPAAQQDTIAEHLNLLVPQLRATKDIELDLLPGSASNIPPSMYSCSELLSHIPAPNTTINKVLAQSCIGDHWNEKVYRPSPGLLLETWRYFVNGAISHSLDLNDLILNEGLKSSNPSLSLLVADDDNNNMASEIFKSVAMTWKLPHGLFAHNGLLTIPTNEATSLQGGSKVKFNPQETTRWVGNLILQVAKDEGTELNRETFEAQWEDAVPAGWVKYCSVEVLVPACVVEKGQTNLDGGNDDEESGRDIVKWRPFLPSSNDATQIATQDGAEGRAKEAPPARASGGGKNKRKWHEKFAAQRNVQK